MAQQKQIQGAAEAFSRQSAIFDDIEHGNEIIKWMRDAVRAHALKMLKPKSHILELNAGTGMDAVFFASKGHHVHAIDIAPGMVNEINRKVKTLGLQQSVEAEQLSYTHLHSIPSGSFDFIFSNFGGLNCVPDLENVVKECRRIIRPGGIVTFVIMPAISPWELMTALKGNLKMAGRRFQKGGADSNVEGISFKTWYYQPGRVKRFFGDDFKVKGWQGLGTLVPPPHRVSFPVRYPGLFRALAQAEASFSESYIFRRCADHYILSMERIV